MAFLVTCSRPNGRFATLRHPASRRGTTMKRLLFSLVLLLALVDVPALHAVEHVGQASAPEQPLALWYRRPAEQWTEALPVGNGRLGAMVFGGVANERLQLNEDTLWAGGPYDPVNPE